MEAYSSKTDALTIKKDNDTGTPKLHGVEEQSRGTETGKMQAGKTTDRQIQTNM